MKKLSLVDKGFLTSEKRETPMHVASVALYTLPDGASEQEFLQGLAANVRSADTLLPPFGDRLRLGRLGLAGNAYWERDDAMDMDYHVRHSALPKPGRYRELFNLVSRLHGTLLERSRPLWEMHLIEGLQNRQFAVYTKTHHAAVDGARGVHIISMLSPDPDHVLDESPLSLESWTRYKKDLRAGKKTGSTQDQELRNVADVLKSTFDSWKSQPVQGPVRLFPNLGRSRWRPCPAPPAHTHQLTQPLDSRRAPGLSPNPGPLPASMLSQRPSTARSTMRCWRFVRGFQEYLQTRQ